MSLLHADNFSIYGTDEDLMESVYGEVSASGVSLVVDPDGVSPGHVLKALGSQNGVRWILPSTQTTVGQAARLYVAGLPTSLGSTPGMQIRDGVNNVLFKLMVTPTGVISVYTGANVLVGSSSGPVVSAGSWFHIEWKMFISATVGTCEVRVEGDPKIDLDTLNTGVTPAAQGYIGTSFIGSGANHTSYWKDYVIWDGGGSANNDFLGSVLVTTLLPTADTALNWSSTGANGYSILDNIPPVDASYISAIDSPIPAAYTATMSDLPATVTSVKALITSVRAAKSDGGDGSLQVGIISDVSGTPATGLGDDRPITTSQAYWRDVFELDPKTSAAWLPPAVNDINLQIDRTT